MTECSRACPEMKAATKPRVHHVGEQRMGQRQRGAASLLIGLALVAAIVALAAGLGHTVALEQRMARNTVLAAQTREAAIAGLGYARAALVQARPAWTLMADGRELATTRRNAPPLHTHAGDRFAINIGFERRPLWRGYIRTEVRAAPAAEPDIEARVSQFLLPLGVLTAAGEEAPPLVVDGCADLSRATDLYPLGADEATAGPVLSSSVDATCAHLGSVNLHGGIVQGHAFAPGTLWNQLMSVSRDELHTLAAAQAAAGVPPRLRDYWWATAADLADGAWRTSLGSARRPIVLVIPTELGCPAFGGGAQLIGLVLIEADCGGGPAWGDVRLYGSLAVRGAFGRLGPTSRLLHISHAPGAPRRIEPPPLGVVAFAGSWKDF